MEISISKLHHLYIAKTCCLHHTFTRSLDMHIKPDNSKGTWTIFIGANRHYPDGFPVVINDSFVLYHNPLKTVGLEVVKNGKKATLPILFGMKICRDW